MRQIFLAVILSLAIGIVAPKIVQALTDVHIIIKNAENNRRLHYGVELTLIDTSSNQIGGTILYVGNVMNGGANAGFDINDDVDELDYVIRRHSPGWNGLVYFTDTGTAQVSRFARSPNFARVDIDLPPVVFCGDGVCTSGEESINGGNGTDWCPYDCTVCGDGTCSTLVEDRVNCPIDCAGWFVRGDLDGDGAITDNDYDMLPYYIYYGDASPLGAPACADAADINDDGVIDWGDTGRMNIGPPFPAPYPNPGPDPTDDAINCN